MDKAEQPTIEQADRDAVTNFMGAIFESAPSPQTILETLEQAFARHRTTSLAAQDGLDEHFPTGLRQRPMRLATTDEVFEGPVFCDCYCGESFAGSDEQEVRQLWAEHALSAIKEQQI